MAINDKLEIIKTGVLDVRNALKEFDHSLGQGNITTIAADINSLASNSIIVLYEDEEGNYKYKCIHVAGTTCPSFQNTDLISGKIISVILPESITLIPNRCFNGQNKLEYINLANVKTFQRDYNFENCNLKKVTIGNIQNTSLASVGLFKNNTSLEEIVFLNKDYNLNFGNDCFVGCSNLKTIKIASLEGWLLNTNGLGPSTHRLYDLNGNEYTEIVVPDTITSLHTPGFERFNNITSITIPDSVTSIGGYTFNECTALSSITIPDSVNFTGTDVFRGCLLDEMTFKGKYTISGTQQPFRYYSALKKLNIDPDKYFLSVPVVGYTRNDISPNSNSTDVRLYNIKTGEEITDVILPNGTIVWNQIFKNCINLVSVNIPEGVTTIGQEAFRGCSSLVSVNIPEGVTTFGNGGNNSIFVGCRKIHDFTLPSTLNWTDLTYYNLVNLGDGTGTFTSNSGYRSGGNQTSNAYYFRKFILNGSISNAQNYPRGMLNLSTNYGKIIILNGNLTDTSVTGSWFIGTPNNQITYCKITGTITGTENNTTNQVIKQANANSRIILHLPNTNQLNAKSRLSDSNIVKIYFGDGTSQAADQAILDTYSANSDWAPDSNKFDLWYNYWDRRSLPTGYTRLQYVKTDSNAWVNTGILGDNNDLSFTVDFMTENYINGAGIFGNYVSENHQGWRFSLGGNNGQTWLNSNNKFNNACVPTYYSINKERVTFDINKQTYSSIYSSGNCNTAIGTVNNDPICLGNISANNPEEKDVGLRIYGFKIKNGDTTVIDYLPCLNSNNVPGFYDFVTNAFVPSSTQTAFSAGPELVNWDYVEI